MVFITEVFVALVVVVFAGWWYKKATKNKEFYDTIPGPTPLPFFGNALEIKSTEDVIPVMLKHTKRLGGVLKIHAGPIHKFVLVSDYKYLESILSSSKILKKTREYDFFANWLGRGLLTSDGDKWRKHRRILTPAFHFQILEQFIEVFESSGNVLIHKLEKEVGKSSVDIYPFITLCALDIICETAMGIKIHAQKDTNSPYVRSVKDMCRIVIERTFSVVQMFDTTYRLTKNYRTEKEALKILHNRTNSVIIERQKELKSNNSKKKEDDFGVKKKLAFLDLLLQATKDGRPLTHEEIREEVDTFMFEGHDTTASAMSFALFCLANNPDVQTKAFEEQRELFGDNSTPVPTYADLQNMKYLDQVIKETLRLYPSVPAIGRITTEPIEIGERTIPKDVPLTLFIYAMQRNPQYYKNPEKFDPSRFDEIDGTLPYAYIPFSAGPRNCIGQKFAMLEMKSTLSKIIRKFELKAASPEHKVKLAAEAVLKSLNGVNISLSLRKKA